jgi:hypothetical protein
MKGYFGIGIEGASKAVNVGTLFRTAHAFGAAFVFTLRTHYNRREGAASDTSDTPRSVPTYHFADLPTFRLLGAAWAMHRLRERHPRFTTVSAATEGNHGRAVAWAARRLGLQAVIYIRASGATDVHEVLAPSGATRR